MTINRAALQLDDKLIRQWWCQETAEDEFEGDLIEAMLTAGLIPTDEPE